MNDKPDSSNDRVEGLLRRWGADEAVGNAKVPPAPVPRPARAPGPQRPIWGFVAAAAAGILVAGVGFYFAIRHTQSELDRTKGQLLAKDTEAGDAKALAARLEGELAGVRADLMSSRVMLAEAQTKLAAMLKDDKAAAARLAQLEGQFQARQKELADAKGRHDALKLTLDEKQAELAKAAKALAGLDQSKTSLAAALKKADRLEKDLADHRTRLAAANSEITRATNSSLRALADRKKAEAELAQLQARQEAVLATYQRTYLAADLAAPAAAPARAMMESEQTGLSARQAAARRNQLLRRHAELRPALRTEPAKALFETLEVLLTRLELLDPDDPVAGESFRALIRQSGLAGRIDELLAAPDEPPQVRSWLMEARLILTGADRV